MPPGLPAILALLTLAAAASLNSHSVTEHFARAPPGTVPRLPASLFVDEGPDPAAVEEADGQAELEVKYFTAYPTLTQSPAQPAATELTTAAPDHLKDLPKQNRSSSAVAGRAGQETQDEVAVTERQQHNSQTSFLSSGPAGSEALQPAAESRASDAGGRSSERRTDSSAPVHLTPGQLVRNRTSPGAGGRGGAVQGGGGGVAGTAGVEVSAAVSVDRTAVAEPVTRPPAIQQTRPNKVGSFSSLTGVVGPGRLVSNYYNLAQRIIIIAFCNVHVKN